MTNLDSVHPWESDRDEFDRDVMPYLKKHGMAIGKAANSGNADAQNIIKYYSMLHRSFDPVSLISLQAAIATFKLQPPQP